MSTHHTIMDFLPDGAQRKERIICFTPIKVHNPLGQVHFEIYQNVMQITGHITPFDFHEWVWDKFRLD